jgi:hypothetical protein
MLEAFDLTGSLRDAVGRIGRGLRGVVPAAGRHHGEILPQADHRIGEQEGLRRPLRGPGGAPSAIAASPSRLAAMPASLAVLARMLCRIAYPFRFAHEPGACVAANRLARPQPGTGSWPLRELTNRGELKHASVAGSPRQPSDIF